MSPPAPRPGRLWLVAGIAALFSPLGAAPAMWEAAGAEAALRWVFQAGLVQAAVLAHILRHFRREAAAGGEPRPEAGPADLLTLLRAGLTAALAGFVLQPAMGAAGLSPAARALPGGIYLLAVLLDLADGFVARRTGGGTRLGERLDGFCDALGLLAASAAAVGAGRAPLVYLGAGGGFFLLRAALRVRAMSGRKVRPIAPRATARLAAGWQMLFAVLLLLPVLEPARLAAAAGVMTALMGASLGQDWLIACGWADAAGRLAGPRPAAAGRLAAALVPLGLRAGVAAAAALLSLELARALPAAAPSPAAAAVPIAALGCVLGVAARGCAVILVICAAHPSTGGDAAAAAALAALAAALVATGAGPWRWWQPEDRFVLKPRPQAPRFRRQRRLGGESPADPARTE
jgi:CDP-diacylglycerol--glycerol-3-phosphate 3-phosphatidyltransferase